MTHYDIAAKVLMETCRDDILRYFLNLDVRESELIENLPQQTVSVRSSDFTVMVTSSGGNKTLVIIEIQSVWDRIMPLRLMEYRSRHMIKHGVKAVSCVILLRPSATASGVYEDNEIRYAFQLVKVYEQDARQVLDEGPLCLLPFVPLMASGPDLTVEADRMIYNGNLPRQQKADMLTSMAILAGLVSRTLPVDLIHRRRDIMIESAAYDIIKEEGRKEGLNDMLFKQLEARFGSIPTSLKSKLTAAESEKVFLFGQAIFSFQSIKDAEDWWAGRH